ncbi:hypothetical protein BT96DRAFT_822167 [Gymnopus androsaceus JB14]|uniref:Uncharacterized protein n=1 Tax=Gymnopus androsaceus JB14 TaxID=1447944 RepID=A0A6A4HJV9_9AGAR|nr:hypothetical protein BT96DRAFT_822167 [Gymnopus androsaceus JB14]
MSTVKISKKRPRDNSPPPVIHKKSRITIASRSQAAVVSVDLPKDPEPESTVKQSQTKPRQRIKKLAPARPFPSVPTAVSATGPRSAHTEGKNLICITRKTSLGAYMRRCKNIIIKDGYNTLHLSAMGAAIPLLLQLSLALPPILPFAPDEIHTEVHTGTVEVLDEIEPENEEEDITYRTRGKSQLKITLKIENGEFSGNRSSRNSKRRRQGKGRTGAGEKDADSGPIVYGEPEQMETETV